MHDEVILISEKGYKDGVFGFKKMHPHPPTAYIQKRTFCSLEKHYHGTTVTDWQIGRKLKNGGATDRDK
jgi:hypothetical protein